MTRFSARLVLFHAKKSVQPTIRCFDPVYIGVNRFYNAADIVRICAPVYLRIDPAPELTYGLNQPWASEDQYTKLAIKKVKYASIINEIIAENAPELTTSR